MPEIGLRPAKDSISVEEYYKAENQSEAKILNLRRPAQEFARKVLP
jgi:hypothetical protein